MIFADKGAHTCTCDNFQMLKILHCSCESFFRSQRKTPPLDDDDRDNLQLRRPSALKKPIVSDGTFGENLLDAFLSNFVQM